MHELTGKISSLAFNRDGKPMITLEMNEKVSALAMADELYSCEKLTLKFDKYKPKRSLNANAYLWKLCDKLADKLSEDGVPHTKEMVYRDAIKSRGIYREQGELPIDFAKTIRHAWEMLGTGWITEQVDFDAVVCELTHFSVETAIPKFNKTRAKKILFNHVRDDKVKLLKDNEEKLEIDYYITNDGDIIEI